VLTLYLWEQKVIQVEIFEAAVKKEQPTFYS